MSELDPKTIAAVNEQYEGVVTAIRHMDPDAKMGTVAQAIARHLAGALVCIEMQQDQLVALRGRIEHLEDEIRMHTGRC